MPNPVRIDPGPDTISRCLPDCGPFEIAGALYVAIQGQFDPDNYVRVYKSTDSGATWVEQDSGNAVQAAQSYRVIRVGDTFQIFYLDWSDGNLKLIEFDTATNLYGAPSDSGINGVQNSYSAAWDGTNFLVIYPLAFDTNLYRVRFAGGFWGTSASIYDTGAGTPSVIGLVMDASRAYLFFNDLQFSGDALKFSTLTSVDGFSAPVTIMAATVRVGQPLLAGSNVLIPVDDRRSGTTTAGAALLWTGTPLAAPVWTAALIQSSAPIVINSITATAASPTDIRLFYTASSTLKMYQSAYNGSTFGADSVYYDAVANPPPVPIPDPPLAPPDIAMYGVGAGLSGSVARVLVQLQYDTLGHDTTFYLPAGGRSRNKFYSVPA
jgi:hypothetical protein